MTTEAAADADVAEAEKTDADNSDAEKTGA